MPSEGGRCTTHPKPQVAIILERPIERSEDKSQGIRPEHTSREPILDPSAHEVRMRWNQRITLEVVKTRVDIDLHEVNCLGVIALRVELPRSVTKERRVANSEGGRDKLDSTGQQQACTRSRLCFILSAGLIPEQPFSSAVRIHCDHTPCHQAGRSQKYGDSP